MRDPMRPHDSAARACTAPFGWGLMHREWRLDLYPTARVPLQPGDLLLWQDRCWTIPAPVPASLPVTRRFREGLCRPWMDQQLAACARHTACGCWPCAAPEASLLPLYPIAGGSGDV